MTGQNSAHLRTARLAAWQVRLLTWSGALLWLSGVAWLVLHNFGQHQGEFGPETNPLEAWMMRLHGAAVLAALVGVGGLLIVHVWRGWQYQSQRVHGLLMLVAVSLLTLTGYGLYYASDEWGRPSISVVHWVLGLITLPLFLWHYYAGRGLTRRR